MRAWLTGFELVSKPWETKQQAAVAKAIKSNNMTFKREYSLTVAAKMAHEQQLLKRLEYTGENESMWLHIPNACRTVSFRATTFRMSSRCGCAAEWHLNRPHRLPPFPLFLNLTDTVNATQIAQEAALQCKDLNDSFTTELLKEFPDLTGPECDARVEHIAQNSKTRTSENEILNGRLRKEAVSKVNTHKVSVPDLGALWIIRESKDDKPSTIAALTKEAETKNASNKSTPKNYRRKKARHRKQRSNPGLARMFYRVVASGHSGTVRPGAVWPLYRQLLEESPHDERLQEAQRLLEAEQLSLQRAKAAKIEVERQQKPSRLRRSLLVKLRRAQVKQIVDDTHEHQRPLAIAHIVRGRMGSHNETKTLARIAQQEISKRRKLDEAADDAALKEYSDGWGKKLVQDVVQTGLVPASGLVSLPSTGAVQSFWYTETQTAQTGKVAAALSMANRSGVPKQINQDFVVGHQPEKPDVKMADAVCHLPKVAECRKAGVCVCKPETKPRLRFRNALYAVVKSHFKPNTPNRPLLTDGFLFLKLEGHNLTTDEESWCFAHVGFSLISPYRLTFQRMALEADPGELAPRPGRLYLGATYDYRFDFRFLEELQRSGVQWKVSFYCLESTEELVEHLRPSPVPAMPMFGGSATIFWKGEKSKASTVDLSEVATICDRIVHVHGAGSDAMAAGSEIDAMDGEVDVSEPGVGGNEGDSTPKSELDKLIEEACEEQVIDAGGDDVGKEGFTFAEDGGDLLQDIAVVAASASAGDGTPGPIDCDPVPAGKGTSSSSTDLPPPPTPHELPRVRSRRSAIGAQASIEVDGGFIAYYTKGVFEAVCRTHDSCVVSRTVSKVTDRELGRPRGGRPLGVMAAWLSKHRCATKDDHWDYENFCVAYEERLLARLSLQAGLFLRVSVVWYMPT